VSETVVVNGIQQDYALGATTLGLMQDFVLRETGLADRLQGWAVSHPDLVFFPGIEEPTRIYGDAPQAAREFADKWGEQGDLAAYRAGEDRVARFPQAGYRAGQPPSVDEAVAELGADLTALWITGSARTLLDHYLSGERTKLHIAMNVSESGPVSLSGPYSAFIIPIMSSGSVFGGNYGYVRGGIWQITRELGRINQELDVELVLSCTVHEVDTKTGVIRYENSTGAQTFNSDHVVFASDPQTAARLSGDSALIEHTMLVEGQSYFDRQYAEDASRHFYQFGDYENVSICGSSTYPCGSVAGTPGYMCVSELLRRE
jgi:phytoene dehydrogenase-like protein